MTNKTLTIEVDEATAETLKTRAAERGVSVPELIAELVTLDSGPIAVESEEIAELDRRWAAIEAGQPTVAHDQVVRWLRTWGTPGFRRWHEQ
jgi:predicted transcriptional regulator